MSGERTKRPRRPIAPVPRLLLDREEAATALAMSVDHFERFVQPHVRMVRAGQKRLVSIRELEAWVNQQLRLPLNSSEADR